MMATPWGAPHKPPIPGAGPRWGGTERWIGVVVLTVLAAFAWRYYLERTTTADSAFFSWLMIDDEAPVSALGRHGSYLPQLLPVVLIRLGASLEAVLRTYSLMFIAFHAILFGLAAFALNDRRAALVIPITLTAGFHYMFYYGISELYQGLSLTVLAWAMACRAMAEERARRKKVLWVLAAALGVMASFYHQLLVLPLVFLVLHEGLGGGRRGRRGLVMYGAALVAWYVVRMVFLGDTDYERERTPSLHDLWEHGRRLADLGSTNYFLGVWRKFPALWLLVMAGVVAGIFRREWLRTGTTLVFSTGCMVLFLVVDRDATAPMILENYYPMLGLFWSAHLASALNATGAGAARLRTAAMAAISALGLLQIHGAHHLLSERVAYLQRLTGHWREQGLRKVLVRPENFPWAYGMGIWPLGMESALVSGVHGPSQAATVYMSGDPALSPIDMAGNEQFLGPTWAPLWFGLNNLDRRYFDLPTDTGYTWANSCGSFPGGSVALEAPREPFRAWPDRLSVVPIMVHNRTPHILPSCTADGKPVWLGHRLFSLDGRLLGGPFRSPLETDLPAGTSYPQGLIVDRPGKRGRYRIEVRLYAGEEPVGEPVHFLLRVDGWPI